MPIQKKKSSVNKKNSEKRMSSRKGGLNNFFWFAAMSKRNGEAIKRTTKPSLLGIEGDKSTASKVKIKKARARSMSLRLYESVRLVLTERFLFRVALFLQTKQECFFLSQEQGVLLLPA